METFSHGILWTTNGREVTLILWPNPDIYADWKAWAKQLIVNFKQEPSEPWRSLKVESIGALVHLTNDTAGFSGGVGSIDWDTTDRNDTWDPKDGGPKQRFWLGPSFDFAPSDINTTNDTVRKVGHGMLNGEGPFPFDNTGGALPTGVAVAEKIWANVVDADHFRLSTSRENALNNVYKNLTNQGTGTHRCRRGSFLVIPKGVDEVVLSGNVRVETDDTDFLTALIAKNYATYYGMPEQYTFDYAVSLTSAALEVVEGDIFHINEEGGVPHTIDGDEKATWLSIRVVSPLRLT